jgi:hypothetical protein
MEKINLKNFLSQIFAVEREKFLNKFPEVLFTNPASLFHFAISPRKRFMVRFIVSQRLPTAMYDNYRSHNESLKALIYLFAHLT